MSSPAFVAGNLTRTSQLSRTTDGTPVVNLTLAENTRRLVEGEWVDGGVRGTHAGIVIGRVLRDAAAGAPPPTGAVP